MEQFKFGTQQSTPIVQALRQDPAQMGGGPMGRGRVFSQGSPISGSSTPYQSSTSSADMGDIISGGKKLWDAGSSLFAPTGAEIGAGAQQYGPEVAKMGGNVVGSGSGGFASSAGPLAALAAAAYGTDQLMNEKGSDKWYSAEKLNDLGTFNVGGKDIGLRGGDFANGINPATWLSDPNKAQKGLLNAFTFGIFD